MYKLGKEGFVLFVKNFYKSMSPDASFKRYIGVMIIPKAKKLEDCKNAKGHASETWFT